MAFLINIFNRSLLVFRSLNLSNSFCFLKLKITNLPKSSKYTILALASSNKTLIFSNHSAWFDLS